MEIVPKRKEGISIEYASFLRWRKSDVIGHYVDEFDGEKYLCEEIVTYHCTPG